MWQWPDANSESGDLRERVALLERENAALRGAGVAACIIESSDDAIIGRSLGGAVTSWNPAAERMFGYRAEETLGNAAELLAWPGREDEMQDIVRRIGAGEHIEHFETVERHKDGHAVHVSLTVSPMLDASGAVVGTSRIARDIGERKQALVSLREAEERYRDLFENSPLSVAVIDPETSRHIDFNRVFCERLGYTREQASELSVEEMTPNYKELLMRALAQKPHGTEHVQFVTQYLTKTGELLDSLVTARLFQREGRILIHSVTFDLSAPRRAEDALRQLGEKEALLKEIHHRVKNNLQVVSSLLGLQSRAIQEGPIRNMFQESQNRVHSMALLHESLYQSESLSRVDFPAYVRQLAAYLFQSYGVRAEHVRLRIELEQLDLGMEAAVPCALIINELLSNSLKYAFPEGRAGEVRIALQGQPGGGARLVVADNGVGMGPNTDWTQTKSLGLRLVRTLAEQLDGKLEIESDQGTEVRLTFFATA